MGKRRSRQNQEMVEPIYLNDDTYFDYLERIRKIALSIFEWKNLPNSMDARFLERCLYFTGAAAMLFDEKLGFINTQACSAGQLNIYGLPTKLNCYSFGYQTQRRVYNGLVQYYDNQQQTIVSRPRMKQYEAILVMNNWERTPTAAAIALFAYRLTEAQRTCDVNIKAQKTPVMILTDENRRLTMKNVYQQYDGNSPVIFGDKNLDLENMKAINTEAPYVADKIMDYKVKIWNEMLNFLGVNNLYEKRERINVEETSINNEVINLNLQSFLAPRQEAARQFNEKFGLAGDKAIEVRVRSDLYNIIKQASSIVNDYKTATDVNTQVRELVNE